jgi:hypothetical protein
MQTDPKPTLSQQGILANIDYSRSLRIKAHQEYLKCKRQERYWREELSKLQPTSDSVEL